MTVYRRGLTALGLSLTLALAAAPEARAQDRITATHVFPPSEECSTRTVILSGADALSFAAHSISQFPLRHVFVPPGGFGSGRAMNDDAGAESTAEMRTSRSLVANSQWKGAYSARARTARRALLSRWSRPSRRRTRPWRSRSRCRCRPAIRPAARRSG